MNGSGDFLGRLASRALGRVSPLQPRLPSRFEPDAPLALGADQPVSEGEAEAVPALSQPPPRPPGEKEAESPTKSESLSVVPPLLPVGGRAMGEEGRGDEGSLTQWRRTLPMDVPENPLDRREGEEGLGADFVSELPRPRPSSPRPSSPDHPIPLTGRRGRTAGKDNEEDEGDRQDRPSRVEVPRPRPSPLPLSRPPHPPLRERGARLGRSGFSPSSPGEGAGEEGRGDEGLGRETSGPAKLAPIRDRLPPERQPLAPVPTLREELVPLRPGSPRAAVRAEAGAPSAAEPAPEPTVRVTIGRIEVRATAPAPPPAPAARPAGPRLTLEEYLRRRSEGRM